MCLDELADFEVKQNWGWQCFRENHVGKLIQRYDHQNNYSLAPVVFDKWQVDPNNHDIIATGIMYKTGFHISLSQCGAKIHRFGDDGMKKVYFRQITAKGYQARNFYEPRIYKTIVARERYVCDKTKRPPKD